jgi:peptidyl-tRNA hydrolase, PTH1 family
MWLLVGLGNPGSGYVRQRHNVGFMALDEIAKAHDCGSWKSKFQGKVTEGKFGREKLLCLKPDTYMNLSGQAVAEAVNFHKLTPDRVVVFHDDLDLAKGKVRTKVGGGHGGHNGLRSIDAHLGPNYHRVRLGIGHPGSKELVHGYVLSDFSAEDKDWLGPMLKSVATRLPLLLEGNEAEFLNKITLDTKPAGKEDTPDKVPGKIVRSEKALKSDQEK